MMSPWSPLAVRDVPGQIIACAESGAAGYLPRDASLDDLTKAIQSAAEGKLCCAPEIAQMLFCHVGRLASNGTAGQHGVLTAREVQILDLIERGQSNKVIAQKLGIELSTVKNHVHNLLAKLGVRRRGEAAALHRRPH